MKIPRFFLAGASSGSGKTTLTCGLLQAFVNRGLSVSSFKCGPDYIDPMFHEGCIGVKSRNLDLFFTSEEMVRTLFCHNAAGSDLAVLEGVMGFYDGVGITTTQASSYHLAKTVKAPVILVVNGRGMSLSLAALIKGFLDFCPDNQIAGVILNQVSAGLYTQLKETIENQLGIAVLGYLPRLADCSLESRHLGLVTAAEVSDLQDKLQKLAATVKETIDLDRLLQLADSAPDMQAQDWQPPMPQKSLPVNIAVARDKAFCFYYGDSLALLEKMGARLLPFSPLEDKTLPAGADGLLLGGGYPELYARQLSENQEMLRSVAAAISDGMPTVAECGGFMYLHRQLEAQDGTLYPMVGAVAGDCFKTDRLRRFGYATFTANQDTALCRQGECAKGHEFHYWDSNVNGNSFTAIKPNGSKSWECIQAAGNLFAGFPHLYWPGCPQFAKSFVECCQSYHNQKV